MQKRRPLRISLFEFIFRAAWTFHYCWMSYRVKILVRPVRTISSCRQKLRLCLIERWLRTG